MSDFYWVTPPDNITRNIELYERALLEAIRMIGARWGQDVQDQARTNAPWEDRTSNARSGIFYAIDGLGGEAIVGEVKASALNLRTDVEVESGSKDTLIITVGHTVFYGKYLEISHGGKYAVILSTIESNLPELEQMLQDLLS